MSKPKILKQKNVSHKRIKPLDLQAMSVERRLQWISDIQASFDTYPHLREVFEESIQKIQASFN